MNLTGTSLRAHSNSNNGSLNSETEMHFTSDEDFIIGHYSGGTIVAGHVLGKRISDTEAELIYQGATDKGLIQAGKAHATFSTDENNHLHMHLNWKWLTGDQTSGQSDWKQV